MYIGSLRNDIILKYYGNIVVRCFMITEC